MKIKHKDEWPELIEVGRKSNLDNDQIILLLALRETENGPEGCEFRELSTIGSGLKAQAITVAKNIKHQEVYYQAALRNTKDEVYGFVDYFLQNQTDKIQIVKGYIDLITQDFIEGASNDYTGT